MKEDTLLFDNQRLEAENDRLRKQLQTEKKQEVVYADWLTSEQKELKQTAHQYQQEFENALLEIHQKLLEKEKEAHQHLEQEIVLRTEKERMKAEQLTAQSEINRLEQRIRELETNLQKSKEANQQLNDRNKFANEKLRDQEQLLTQLQNSQAELSNYKQTTFELLEKQKQALVRLFHDQQQAEAEAEKLRDRLADKTKAFALLEEKYTRMANTKTMKWTGRYWKLRKKLLFATK